jgi:hypothetical protein
MTVKIAKTRGMLSLPFGLETYHILLSLCYHILSGIFRRNIMVLH